MLAYWWKDCSSTGAGCAGAAAKTISDLRWSLELHLLPFFAGHDLSAITPADVRRYVQSKLAEREAIERERTAAVETGERYTRPAVVERVDQQGGRAPAADPRGRGRSRRAADGEPGARLSLRWQHVDLGTGTLHVVASKTDAGVREVRLSPALREQLTLWRKDSTHTDPAAFVISTATGRRQNPENLRRDVLAKTLDRANVRLVEVGIAPIGHLTFHGLRRTYASLGCICGDDVRYTADQLGHEDPRFTLRTDAQASKRRDRLAKPQRQQYDAAREWAALGTSDALSLPAFDTRATKSPA